MAGVRFEARVQDGFDFLTGAQPLGKGCCVGAVSFHAQPQGLQPAGGQETVLRPGHRSPGELLEAHGLRQILAAELLPGHDHRSAEHIRVPADVLGGRMHHGIRAQKQRALQERGGEGVVHDQQGTCRMGDPRPARHVRDAQQRVRRGFDPEQRGLPRLHGRGDNIQVRDVHGGVGDPPLAVQAVDEPVGASVAVGTEHDVVARGQHRAQQRVLCGDPGGEGETGVPALQGVELDFESVAGRVGAAGVLVPVAQHVDPVLHEGAGLVDRRDDRPGERIGRLARMDGLGVETLVAGGSHRSAPFPYALTVSRGALATVSVEVLFRPRASSPEMRSATRSRASSSPAERRSVPGAMPAA